MKKVFFPLSVFVSASIIAESNPVNELVAQLPQPIRAPLTQAVQSSSLNNSTSYLDWLSHVQKISKDEAEKVKRVTNVNKQSKIIFESPGAIAAAQSMGIDPRGTTTALMLIDQASRESQEGDSTVETDNYLLKMKFFMDSFKKDEGRIKSGQHLYNNVYAAYQPTRFDVGFSERIALEAAQDLNWEVGGENRESDRNVMDNARSVVAMAGPFFYSTKNPSSSPEGALSFLRAFKSQNIKLSRSDLKMAKDAFINALQGRDGKAFSPKAQEIFASQKVPNIAQELFLKILEDVEKMPVPRDAEKIAQRMGQVIDAFEVLIETEAIPGAFDGNKSQIVTQALKNQAGVWSSDLVAKSFVYADELKKRELSFNDLDDEFKSLVGKLNEGDKRASEELRTHIGKNSPNSLDLFVAFLRQQKSKVSYLDENLNSDEGKAASDPVGHNDILDAFI